jgi:putative N-acetyltransferase (TIGR04045 family)
MSDVRTGRRLRVECRPAATPEELDTHYRIRHTVFVEEQQLFARSDRDGYDDDPDVVHVLAFLNGEAVGTVRLFPLDRADRLWQGDRLAVVRSARIHGLGRPLVRFAVATAGERGGREMVAHIQLQNVALFERLGWHKHGDIEVYVGVAHQPMAIDLQAARR